MKRYFNQVQLTAGKVEQRHVRIGLIVLTFVLLALAGGAPASSGCC